MNESFLNRIRNLPAINKVYLRVKWQLIIINLFKNLSIGLSIYIFGKIFFPSGYIPITLAIVGVIYHLYTNKAFTHLDKNTQSWIHENIETSEYSLDLLSKNQLNTAEELQIDRLNAQLEPVKRVNVFSKSLIYFLLAPLLALGIFYFPKEFSWEKPTTHQSNSKTDTTSNKESIETKMPKLISSKVQITPPNYTGITSKISDQLDIKALTGSKVKWSVKFNGEKKLKVVLNNTANQELSFKKNGDIFEYTDQIRSTGLYAIRAYWADSLIYQSDYYRIEALPDQAPKIEPADKEFYKFHFEKDSKIIRVSAKISDDFLVREAWIVATLARGSGESVRFREQRFNLDKSNFKSAQVNKTLNLKNMDFRPGDELYYYWAAVDNKTPNPNFSKSDTYFIIYKDTNNLNEGQLTTMAINILPEYFRSQRQIIIDTEKLIAQRGKINTKNFNSQSNEIGFDQKALRLRYGQYLGEENEGSIGGDHNDSEDLLEGFMHKHDSENEDLIDLSPPENHNHESTTDPKDPLAALLAEYTHSHDDAEANTFYESSTRSLLKSALENMWQSELHLRLNEPEKALPYENKALEFLKEAQQKARVFIAKTDYDPPPIKEGEKRMTGELSKFNRTSKSQLELTQIQRNQLILEVLSYIDTKTPLNNQQKYRVILLDKMLGQSLVNSGMNQWKILTFLRKMMNDESLKTEEKEILRKSLYAYIEKPGNISKEIPDGNKNLRKAYLDQL